ncbi:class I SAM-dependent methyltransferase [Paractinoplanes lichenicola]|uniref:Class I SAM-dependent methyltransferase n=1 Tax=Paractinoplanes lichenicola TaxID=2802976 RepID=A0ABS1VDX6_9ACTN|nr:class I SAM-dependent methyltransferase [Actinoplanes lichenicola]MBL7252838.1 class I SAM-dependent methyltransferase [Actinoplanes lichenicola]
MTYAFDNDDPASVGRHSSLAAMLDDLTTRRLAGLDPLAGRRCLELGAGGGSVASWLAGHGARVTATDVNLRHLPPDPPFEVLRHDLTREPLPAGPWDVIHARLLLLHLPQRHEILRDLVTALAPGGALLIEDFETTYGKGVMRAPSEADVAAYEEYHAALIGKVLPALGNDPTWAGRVHAEMLGAGLTSVDTEVHARSWPGGSPGAALIVANIAQQRQALLDAGVSDVALDRVVALMADPGTVLRGHLVYSTLGRARS